MADIALLKTFFMHEAFKLHISLSWSLFKFIKALLLLNYYGDVVGVHICYVHICCEWIFLTYYWCWIVGVNMYWNMSVLIVEVMWIYALLSIALYVHAS